MRLYIITLFSLVLVVGCTDSNRFNSVEIIKNHNGYQLLLDGNSFYIKGAVAWNKFDLVKQYGGNAVRTSWRRLDMAAENGLGCLVNLPVRAERDGMNYDDSVRVQKQFNRIISLVDSLKTHPAVLMWALGNELDWIPPGVPYNQKVWGHLNDLAVRIHHIDPHHPVLTTIGSVHEKVIREFILGAPEMDLLGVNEYGDILKLAGRLREFGWTKPYVLTEWGPTGFWQVPKTEWGVPIEETSTEKADAYRERYEKAILQDKEMCLGSFVFLWNQHQERTHTWFGMFDAQWRETEAVDVMRKMWTGGWPENRAPRLDSISIDSKPALSNIYLKTGQQCTAEVFAHDTESDPLTFNWEVLREGSLFPYGGRGEERPPAMPDLIADPSASKIKMFAPAQSGSFRLFVYVYDDHFHFATANIPFYVR
ncbi:hypothetical protein JW935_26440 [candidate division KSB1 bacterium]|nr:hypothetical protein [candidate division KSB1 bacterium]